MAIVAGDIEVRLSVKTGAAGNSTASTPAGSLGKYMSTTVLDTGTTLHNLFDVVSGAENAASESEYRCLFVFNDHASLSYQGVTVYLTGAVASGCDITIGVDAAAASAKDSASAQADEIANEDTAPDPAVTFGAHTAYATGLALGDIAAGYCRAFWLKRTTANTAAVANDGVTINITGGTAA